MSTKLLTVLCSVAPGSLGHHWDSHTGAASIKLVQAGQASVCYTGCLLSNELHWTDTHLDGAPPATSCSLMIQTGKGTQRNVGRRDLAMEVSGVWDCYHITKADNASVLSLCEMPGCTLGKVFQEKDSIIHTTLCPMCVYVICWCLMMTSDLRLQLPVVVRIKWGVKICFA